jgi:hypothetical protein
MVTVPTTHFNIKQTGVARRRRVLETIVAVEKE